MKKLVIIPVLICLCFILTTTVFAYPPGKAPNITIPAPVVSPDPPFNQIKSKQSTLVDNKVKTDIWYIRIGKWLAALLKLKQ